MFLPAPTSGQVPKPNRSPKGAFTNRPLPKIKKFVPKDEDGDEDGESRKPKIKEKLPDSAFMAWLREKQTSKAFHVDLAKDYIMEGAPYKGDSTFQAKEPIKERGGSWCANPDKRKDCDDKSIRRGWWAAHGEAVLRKLLRLPPDDRGRRQWTPLGMGSTQINFLLTWLDEFYGNMQGDGSHVDPSENADAEPLPKRARGEATSPQNQTPQWIINYNAKYVHIWVHDTKCVKCDQLVTDQFMDCGCGVEVKWERCVKCGEKYRTDFERGSIRNSNAWCACKSK